jgi:hypothetical protein
MTVDGARRWIIITSLVVTGLAFAFLVAAPPLGYPLGWDQSQRIIEILLPVFLGYLGTATHFVFHTGNQDKQLHLGSRAPLLGLYHSRSDCGVRVGMCRNPICLRVLKPGQCHPGRGNERRSACVGFYRGSRYPGGLHGRSRLIPFLVKRSLGSAASGRPLGPGEE